MNRSTTRRVGWLVSVLIFAFTACSSAPIANPEEPRQMTFMAGFAPQANLPFVGVYVADELGYFEEAGLEVNIVHSSGEHLQLLAAGEVDVTTQDAGVLLLRRADPGLPLVSLALVGQTGQQAFVALAESGISDLSDWEGKKIGFKGTPPPDLLALIDAAGLDQEDVDLVNVGFDPRALTEGQVDVYPVFKSNEPDTLERWGYELVSWEAADFGIPTLGLTYVATESAISEHPDMFEAFLPAAMRGIEFARENPEQAIDIVMGHVGEDADRDHQMFILQTELADSVSEVTIGNATGWQTEEQWAALADFLARFDVLPTDFDVSPAFTNSFLGGN